MSGKTATRKKKPDAALDPKEVPIERQCQSCDCLFAADPRLQPDGTWELGPCPATGKGRKKCGTVHVYVPEEGLTFTRAELDAQAKVEDSKAEAALAPYLDGREYDRETFIREARFFLGQALEGAIEAGKRLVALREVEGYGDFCKILEKDIGIPTATAYRMMKLAERAPLFPTLGKVKRLSTAYQLIELSDEDLEEMEQTGLLDGKPIDELDRMTVRELREACRKLKKENTKGEEQVKKLRRERDSLRRGRDGELTELDHASAQALKVLAGLSLVEIEDGEREAAENYFISIADALEAVRVNLTNTGGPR
ncbi:hypothetical protein LCGC14_1465560 [marine sediment metagenome]|uniref:DUF3102 domain-containing protein n=1 Tax=marine sediment metagenome TaxID=412755 RepID=A0A0F9JZV6_9ZZZZ